jgi:hypothetical protein
MSALPPKATLDAFSRMSALAKADKTTGHLLIHEKRDIREIEP